MLRRDTMYEHRGSRLEVSKADQACRAQRQSSRPYTLVHAGNMQRALIDDAHRMHSARSKEGGGTRVSAPDSDTSRRGPS